MNTLDLIRYNLQTAAFVTDAYLADFTEEELLKRPVPAANHVKWQLGHLIASAHEQLTALGADVPELPEGFAAAHAKENAGKSDSGSFWPKQEYFRLQKAIHAAALQFAEGLSADQLAAPGPESMQAYAPTVGAVLMMIGLHDMMHTGQYAVLRRALGKPLVM